MKPKKLVKRLKAYRAEIRRLRDDNRKFRGFTMSQIDETHKCIVQLDQVKIDYDHLKADRDRLRGLLALVREKLNGSEFEIHRLIVSNIPEDWEPMKYLQLVGRGRRLKTENIKPVTSYGDLFKYDSSKPFPADSKNPQSK